MTNVGGEQSTLLTVTNRPTNQQFPVNYLSLRINLKHDQYDEVLVKSVLCDVDDYIAYPHNGKQGNNPHFHVFIPCDDRKQSERFRNRIKRHVTGNRGYSIKFLTNGLDKGIQYGSREKTVAFVSNDDMRTLVDAAPPWVEMVQSRLEDHLDRPTRTIESKMRSWQLNYSNIVKQTVLHAQNTRQTHLSMRDIVRHMQYHGNWLVSKEIVRGGVPPFYEQMYELQLGKRKAERMDDSWWNNWQLGR